MRRVLLISSGLTLLVATSFAQGKRLWVLRAPGEMVEYDTTNFAVKQTVKVPEEAVQAPQSVAVNPLGQILFAPAVSLPLAEGDVESAHKAWLWNGKSASTLDPGLKRETARTGSNQAVTESAPAPFLSADGGHLFWFANQARRLQREDVDLSTATDWRAWRTDMIGGNRDDIAEVKLPDCSCSTGSCEESCPYGVVSAPLDGVGDFFLMTQFVAGKTEAVYKATALYRQAGAKWSATALSDPLHRVLDAAPGGDVIVEAIPDTGCCGWSNQSDDQTVVRSNVTSNVGSGGKSLIVFDERATYKNPDYDVSFYTSNARLSPDLANVAMTIVSTAQAGKAIQLAEDGEANPEESKLIRAALTELPAVEVKNLGDSPRRLMFVPHATLVGWLNEKEVLVVEDKVLAVCDVTAGTRRKSNVHVDDAAQVFLR